MANAAGTIAPVAARTTEPAGGPRLSPASRLRQPRAALAVPALVVTVATLASGSPTGLLVGTVLAAASVARRRLPLDLSLLAASLGCVAVALGTGLLASFAGVDVVSHRVVLTVLLLAGAVLSLVDAVLRPTAATTSSIRRSWLAFVPAALAGGIAWIQAATTSTAMSWSFVGTDIAQQVLTLQEVQRVGRLDYTADQYPRGVHMLLALVSGPSMPTGDPVALLAYDVRLMAAVTWLSFAVVLVAASAATLRLARLLGVADGLAVAAAAICTMGMLLLNPLVLSFVYMGAAPSLLAMVALWAVPLAALEMEGQGQRTSATTMLVVAVVSVAVLGHLWQPLAPVPVLALAAAVVRRPRQAWRRPSRGTLVVGIIAAVVTVAVPAPAVLGVLRARGLATAAIAGAIPSMPVVPLLGGVAAICWMVIRHRTTPARALAGTSVGLLLVAVVLMGGSGRMDPTQYYVAKPLWFLGVALLPVLAVTSVPLAARALGAAGRLAQRLGPLANVARASAVALAVALVVAFVLPIEAVVGSAALDTVTNPDGNSVSGRDYTTAVDYATRFSPAVAVPVDLGDGPFPDFLPSLVTSKLMRFITGQPQNHGQPLEVCADVRSVAGSSPAVVVTTLDPAALAPVMRAGGCADVPVVRVPGPPRRLALPLDASKAVRVP